MMTKTAKALLVLAIVCLVAGGLVNLGWLNPGNIDALYTLLPVGAVLFGLFLITLVMGKQTMAHEPDLPEPDFDTAKPDSNEGPARPSAPDSSH